MRGRVFPVHNSYGQSILHQYFGSACAPSDQATGSSISHGVCCEMPSELTQLITPHFILDHLGKLEVQPQADCERRRPGNLEEIGNLAAMGTTLARKDIK